MNAFAQKKKLGGTMSEEQVLPEFIATLKAAAEKATPGPWRWGIHDYSMASLTGPREEEQHVISVSPCESCQKGLPEPKEWEFGRCTTPTENNADYIALASPDAILKLIASLAQSEAERERLREDLRDWKGNYERCRDLAIEAQKELARERKLHRWIEIKDGLPKYKQVVLLLCGDGAYQEVAVYRPDNPSHRWECHSGYKPQNITHWKPLTSPALLEDKSKPVAATK